MSQPNKIHLLQHARAVLLGLDVLIACSGRLGAQTQADTDRAFSRLAWSTDSTAPKRFISVHGRRAAIFGYSEDGLEVWAYPLQILSSCSVTFRQQGATTGIDGQTLLRRIIYSPETVTRIYAGPDFIVREKLHFRCHSTIPTPRRDPFAPESRLALPVRIQSHRTEAARNRAAPAYGFGQSRRFE